MSRIEDALKAAREAVDYCATIGMLVGDREAPELLAEIDAALATPEPSRAEVFAKSPFVHQFTGNREGVTGADNCQICFGRWLGEPETDWCKDKFEPRAPEPSRSTQMTDEITETCPVAAGGKFKQCPVSVKCFETGCVIDAAAAKKCVPHGGLPDSIRVPLHSLQADMPYLLSRLQQEGADVRPVVEQAIQSHLAALEVAVTDSVSSRAVQPEAVAWRVTAEDGYEGHVFRKESAAKQMLRELKDNGWLDAKIEPLGVIAAAPAVPDGYVLVPREPTDAMLKVETPSLNAIAAMCTYALNNGFNGGQWPDELKVSSTAETYRYMIAAAPQPAGDADGPKHIVDALEAALCHCQELKVQPGGPYSVDYAGFAKSVHAEIYAALYHARKIFPAPPGAAK